MRTRHGILAALAAVAALAAGALGGAGCSTERLSLTLPVGAAPNPVTGVGAAGGRTWEWRVTITNPGPVGVFLEYYHTAVSQTDTGYEQAFQVEKQDPVLGTRIAPGAALTFVAARRSEGRFSQGTERRVYHTLGDDGRYYSGQVQIRLQ